MIEIEEKHLLGKRVKFQLTAEGAERLQVRGAELLIRVVEIKSDQISREIVSLGGYDAEYTNFTIYGDEISDIIPTAKPVNGKDVTHQDLKRGKNKTGEK